MPWQPAPETPDPDIEAYVRQFRKKSRFLVDESLGIEVANVLRDMGWNAKFVSEVGLGGHSDEDIFAHAWSLDRILLTHDRDFLDDRRFPPYRNPGVVVLPGAEGDEEALLRALVAMSLIVAPFREGYRGTKVVVAADETWTFIRRNPNTGAMERTRIRGVRRGQSLEIWTDDPDGHHAA
jgi:predicted nuclease of predicted toxin-antitoxin system